MCRAASLSASAIFFFLAIAITVTPSSQESDRVDPFYEKLFSDGIFFFKSGNYPEAVENFEIAFFGFLDHPSKLLECYIYLTVCHFKLKDLEKAKHYLDEIDRLKLRDRLEKLKLPEDLADAFLEVTTYLDRLGLRAKTGAPFSGRRATALSPPTPTKKDKAPPSKTARIEQPPDPLVLAREEKSLRKKISYYYQALEKDPGNLDIYFEMGDAYIAAKKYRDAAAVFEGLLQYFPKNLRIHTELANAYYLNKSYGKALNILARAREIEDTDEVCYLLGKTYMALKKHKEAAAEFSRLLSQNPDYKDAPALYKLCLDRIK